MILTGGFDGFDVLTAGFDGFDVLTAGFDVFVGFLKLILLIHVDSVLF